MKKIIALVLAIMMIASMSVVVFAAETLPLETAPAVTLENEDNEKETNLTKVEYKPTLGYIVIIPGSLELAEKEETTADGATTYYGYGTGPISINKAKIPAGSTLSITVDGKNDIATEDDTEMNWKLIGTGKAEGLKIFYNITLKDKDADGEDADMDSIEETVLEQGDVVLSYTSGKSFKAVTGELTFETERLIQAGDFEDTLTFVAEVK